MVHFTFSAESFILAAATELAPGMVEYGEQTYESIKWREGSRPSKAKVETLAKEMAENAAMDDLRFRRNGLLSASDWTQAADAPVDAKTWAAYRQALRDLPATIKDPTQPVDWPTPPE